MKVFYFTGTGNSLQVAKSFGGELYSIPQILNTDELDYEDEEIGIVFPCYGVSFPSIVDEFIKKARLKSPYIFAIMTYGDTAGNGIGHFAKYAKKNGIALNYANKLLMVDNFLPMFDIEVQKSLNKNIDENLTAIVKDVSEKREFINKGSIVDSMITTTARTVMKLVGSSLLNPKKFIVNDECNNCGTCVKVCPRNNVSIKSTKSNPKPSFGSSCEFCLSCVNNCPQKAIKFKKEKNCDVRFRNDSVTLKEIVESNNQTTL